MHDDRSIASPPNPASGAPPPKHKLLGRALLWAFLCCFLWLPLAALFAHLSNLIPRPFASIYHIVFERLWPPMIIASVILYPACLTKNSPVFRAFMALLIGVALFGCAFFLWVVIIRPPLGVGP